MEVVNFGGHSVFDYLTIICPQLSIILTSKNRDSGIINLQIIL